MSSLVSYSLRPFDEQQQFLKGTVLYTLKEYPRVMCGLYFVDAADSQRHKSLTFYSILTQTHDCFADQRYTIPRY